MYTRKNPKSEGVAIIGGAVSRFGRFESFNSRDLVHEAYIETIKSVYAFGSIPHLALDVPGPSPVSPPELIAIQL